MDIGIFGSILQRIDVFLLVFLRVLGLFVTAPVLSNRLVPVQMRVAISFGVTVVVSPLFQSPPLPNTLVGLVPLAVRELLVGMVIGFVAVLAFTAVQFAGELLDINMGLSMINVLDPMTNIQMPVLGNFLYILGLLIFLSINGHHLLLRALMDSYALVPLGTGTMSAALSESVIRTAGNLFIIGFKVAAPVLAAVFLTTVALGILNRAMPQMNVFMVGLPVQLAMGVFMLMIVLPLYVTFLQTIFRGMFTDVYTSIRLLKG